jgi:hypothetical protein
MAKNQMLAPLEFKDINATGFFKSLNPLEMISETIAQIVYYKQQIKMLETEQVRIDAQAKLCHHQIDARLQVRLEWLAMQQNALQVKLQIVAKDLKNVRLEKKKLHKSLAKLVDNLSNPNLSTADKQLSHTAIPLLTDLVKNIGAGGLVKLDLLINTHISLATMPNDNFHLPFQGEQ